MQDCCVYSQSRRMSSDATIQHPKIKIFSGACFQPSSKMPAGKLIFFKIDDHKFSIFSLKNLIRTVLLSLQSQPQNELSCQHTAPESLDFLGACLQTPQQYAYWKTYIFQNDDHKVTFLFKNLINTELLSLKSCIHKVASQATIQHLKIKIFLGTCPKPPQQCT